MLAEDKMTIRNKLKEEAEYISSLTLSTGILAVYLLAGGLLLEGFTSPLRMIAAIPTNLAVSGIQAAIELTQDNNVEEYRGRVKNIGYSRAMQTKGALYWADIETEEGRIKRVYDAPRVLKGKITNTIIPTSKDLENRLAWYQKTGVAIDTLFIAGSEKGLEFEKYYRFTTTDSVLGSILLKAEEI